MESESRATERLARDLADSAAEGLIALDGLGCVLAANRSACAFVGRSADSLRGASLDNFMTIHGVGRVDETVPVDRPLVGTLCAADGVTHDISLMARRSAEGTLCLAFRPMSDDTRVESLYRDSQSATRAMLRTVRDSVVVIRETGLVIAASESASALLRWDQDALHARAWDALISPQDQEAIRRALSDADEPRAIAALVRRGDGTEFQAHIRIEPFPSALGGGAVFLIEPSNNARSTIPDAELLEELRTFAYVASHDLREPLRSITSFLDLLHQRYSDRIGADGAEFIGFARKGAEQLRTRLEALLDYARAEATEPMRDVFDLGDAASEVEESLRGLIDSIGARVEIHDLPATTGDRVRVQQVLQNLMSNAIRFRDPDRPLRIEVSAERDTKSGLLIVSVRDNGIGIEPRYLTRIFGLFKRLDPAGQTDGTGIGLAICERIVQRHGGRIWAESDGIGKGSAFRFTLPGTDGEFTSQTDRT